MSATDLRQLVAQIRAALDQYPKEALADLLAYVFKEYVVEGRSAVGALPIDAQSELDGLSFAQLVAWLQLHLDLPELALFEVQGERVIVRAAGRAVPLEAQASRPEPLPPAAPPMSEWPFGPPRSAAQAPPSAAPPATGATSAAATELASSARPATSPPATSPPATSPPATSPPATRPPSPSAAAGAEEPADPSGRFALLEVD